MTTAFQFTAEAFQLSPLAFQIDDLDLEAFECGPFQTDAFQVSSTCVIGPPVDSGFVDYIIRARRRARR